MIELATGQALSTASPNAFFEEWINHSDWPAWSPDTEWVTVTGPVQTGASGVLKPKGGPRVKFTVTECEPGREYTDTAKLLGARLVFQHTAEPAASGTDLRVRVTMAGPLARAWALVMGGGFRDSAQADLDRLVTLVEAK